MGFVALWHMDQGLKPMSPALTALPPVIGNRESESLSDNTEDELPFGSKQPGPRDTEALWSYDLVVFFGLWCHLLRTLKMRPERSRAGSCSSQHTQGQKGPSTEEVPPTHAECVVVSEQRLNISVFDSEKGNWKSLHDYPRFTDTPKSQERKPENGRGKAGSGAEMELEGMAGELGLVGGGKVSELVDFAVILECAEIVTWGLVQKSLTGARTRASELSWGTISGHSHAGEGMVLRMKWSVKVPKRPSPVQQPP
ncbi:hypothetical protein MJT46_007568 [Ovis ammon polii x Ovis aries]|nr:hypothetical protein MJT46_007568 [Ovis ammon polii x Ovis aries]